VNKLKYSYLYTDLYEPIVHRTFGVDLSKWNIIVQLKDLFAEIITGSCGFGHPDHNG
ncbi:32753_t:CDS:1, partial [Racocetra persica]